MEIREVALFEENALPTSLAMGMADMLRDARSNGPTSFE